MPYLVCDRVLNLEPGVTGTAIKNVTFSEDYLATHFPLFPVMPAAMMIDAVGAIAGQVLAAGLGCKAQTFLVTVSESKFRRFVRPGDELRIEVRSKRLNHNDCTAEFCAEITVDGERTATLRHVVLGWEIEV
jgi:3-hydroxyacyl-[acyl-carrier-protein] dehydratase